MQYWPIFERQSGAFIGCCGLRPYGENVYEFGCYLLPKFWGRGYALEAATAVIDYAFSVLHTKALFAWYNPNNVASKKVAAKI